MFLHFGRDLIGSAIRNVGGTPITASSGRSEAEDVVAEARHEVAVLAQRLRLREPSRRPATVTDDQVIAVVIAVVDACGHGRSEVLQRLLSREPVTVVARPAHSW